MGLIDIHTHILYGVDDGAKSIGDSMGILDEEREQDVDKVILTPHYGPKFGHPDVGMLKERYMELCDRARQYYPEISLYLGSELYYQQETVSDLKQGKALTMNDTRYVLVEFGITDSYSYICRAMQEFGYAGYIPIIAHAERYEAVFGQVRRIEELINMGAYIQLNAESLIGGIFNKKTSFCKKLIKEGFMHFLGSDCHDLRERRPYMRQAAQLLIKKEAEHILERNPKMMLEGKNLL